MTLQIGVIGCGAIGQDHIRRLTRTLSGARVVAVNDIDPQQARDAVTKYGLDAEIYGDGHEVVAAADVQAVLVTSWGPTHEAFVLDAIAHGKAVVMVNAELDSLVGPILKARADAGGHCHFGFSTRRHGAVGARGSRRRRAAAVPH